MNENGVPDIEVASYAEPAIGVADANEALEAAWAEILAEPARRAEAAALLHVDPGHLPEKCPFEVRAAQSGLTASEYLVVAINLGTVFAGDVVRDLVKDVVKDKLKSALRAVWERLLFPKAEERLPHQGLGRRRPEDDVQ